MSHRCPSGSSRMERDGSMAGNTVRDCSFFLAVLQLTDPLAVDKREKKAFEDPDIF